MRKSFSCLSGDVNVMLKVPISLKICQNDGIMVKKEVLQTSRQSEDLNSQELTD